MRTNILADKNQDNSFFLVNSPTPPQTCPLIASQNRLWLGGIIQLTFRGRKQKLSNQDVSGQIVEGPVHTFS